MKRFRLVRTILSAVFALLVLSSTGCLNGGKGGNAKQSPTPTPSPTPFRSPDFSGFDPSARGPNPIDLEPDIGVPRPTALPTALPTPIRTPILPPLPLPTETPAPTVRPTPTPTDPPPLRTH